MGSIQSSTMILCALENRSASFLSRRAHLLTTPVGRWYFRWKPCAHLRAKSRLRRLRSETRLRAQSEGMRLLRQPDGQCHFSDELLSLSTQLVCGKRSQNTVASIDGIPATARTNLPQHKALPAVAAALFAVMTISIADSHFLFQKEKQKLYERIGKTKWRSIIWKLRSLAGAQDDPPAPLLPI